MPLGRAGSIPAQRTEKPPQGGFFFLFFSPFDFIGPQTVGWKSDQHGPQFHSPLIIGSNLAEKCRISFGALRIRYPGKLSLLATMAFITLTT